MLAMIDLLDIIHLVHNIFMSLWEGRGEREGNRHSIVEGNEMSLLE